MDNDKLSKIKLEFAFIPGVVTAHIDIPVEESETTFVVGQGKTDRRLHEGTVRTVPVIGIIVKPHRVVGDGRCQCAVGIKGACYPLFI